MKPITDARVFEIADKFQQYPMSKELSLRGPGILEFARALLAEAAGNEIADGLPETREDLYWRLHSISKSLEGSGRLDEHENPNAYATVLDAMIFVRTNRGDKP